MGPDSEMPLVRTIGNRIFAWILGALSKRIVKDTASGMRVIRRDALESLYPLPDGLHFTPAMSARALLEDKLNLVEVPMPYSERVGRSKLSVMKDGIRFLTVILRAAVAHRPSRPLLLAAAGLVLATLAVAFQPASWWLSHGELREPMIYRVMLASLLATLSAIVISSAAVSERMAALVHRRAIASRGVTGLLERLLSRGAQALVDRRARRRRLRDLLAGHRAVPLDRAGRDALVARDALLAARGGRRRARRHELPDPHARAGRGAAA